MKSSRTRKYRVFVASRIVTVDEVVPSIIGVLFFVKGNHGETYVRVECSDIHALLYPIKSLGALNINQSDRCKLGGFTPYVGPRRCAHQFLRHESWR